MQRFGSLRLLVVGASAFLVAIACGTANEPESRNDTGGASGSSSGSSGAGGTATGGTTGATGPNGGTGAGAGMGATTSGGQATGGADTGGAGVGAGAAAGSDAGASSGGTAGSSAGAGTVGGAGSGGAGAPGGAGGAGGGAGGSRATDAAFCAAQLTSAATQYEGFRTTYTNVTQVPRSATGGTVRNVGVSDWTSGFPAGSYWLLYEHTGDMAWRTAAEARTAALQAQAANTGTHDVGFIINNSFGKGHRLTQNAQYRTTVLQAAQSLASRYDAEVGCTRSWDFGSWTFPVIIDNMMNLELLLHATELGGEQRFSDIAVSHATKTMMNHFRTDFSSYHVVDYNPTTGAVIRKQTNQGLSDESAWARGQTWGLYGFTMVYRVTHDARFLTHAQRIADFYTQSPRMPADAVPYFDFDAPTLANVPDHRDASAGAIAASGLLELSGFVTGAARERYLDFAIRALRSLSSSSYRAVNGENSRFLLMHSVGSYPGNEEIDVAINYADYYYLEALMRCAALE